MNYKCPHCSENVTCRWWRKNILKVVLIFLSSVLFIFYLVIIQHTNSLDYTYLKSLNYIGYPNNPASRAFPSKIPKDAQEMNFNYMPPLGQGGQVFYLTYTTTIEDIDIKKRWLSKNTSFVGSVSENEPEKTGIYNGYLTYFENNSGKTPDDIQLYLVYSKPYKSGNWNHGEVGFVAVSELQQQLLFYFENW